MLQTMLKVLGFLLLLVFLEYLFQVLVTVGLAVEIRDSGVYDAVLAALPYSSDKDVASLAVVGGVIGSVGGFGFLG